MLTREYFEEHPQVETVNGATLQSVLYDLHAGASFVGTVTFSCYNHGNGETGRKVVDVAGHINDGTQNIFNGQIRPGCQGRIWVENGKLMYEVKENGTSQMTWWIDGMVHQIWTE